MIRLYEGSGSSEIQLLDQSFPSADWERLKAITVKLLERRGAWPAAAMLQKNPFSLYAGTNGFNDEFQVLYMKAPLASYVEIAETSDDPNTRYQYRAIAEAVTEIGPYVRFIAVELDTDEGPENVITPVLSITSDVVERALRDAEQLIASVGATSGVDRLHTAFHGYLRALVTNANIAAPQDANITQLFQVLRQAHPGIQEIRARQSEIDKILRSLAGIVDALNPVRNHASVAHPNETLLEGPEAMLVINSIKSLLHYLNERTRV